MRPSGGFVLEFGMRWQDGLLLNNFLSVSNDIIGERWLRYNARMFTHDCELLRSFLATEHLMLHNVFYSLGFRILITLTYS
jgi:hypothetical protein